MPVLLLGGLALLGGGFDVQARHLAGIGSWLIVLILLLSPYRKRIRFGNPFLLVAGLLLGLAVLSACSSLWSSSTSRSLIEAERVIAYLGFFSLAYLICRTDKQRQRFGEGLVIALAFIIVLALADRCLPGTGIPPISETARMRYPLGYWNANGLVCGVGVVLFAWAARNAGHAVLRWFSVAIVPAALIALYLTYSRGGLLAGIVAVVAMFFLSRHRLRFTAVIGIGVLVAAPAIQIIQNNPAIAQNLGGAEAPAQGRTVALVIVLSMLAAVLLLRGLIELASRMPSSADRALGVSRDQRVLKAIAATVATVLVSLVVVFGGHIWDQFSGGELYFPESPESHFTQLSGAGRYDFNSVAIDSFVDNPLTGTGAGTYKFEWTQNRSSDLIAQDAHSLYLESFADLGLVGGLMVLSLIISMVWLAILAWRLSPPADRDRTAALLAVLLGIVVALGIDWTWELAATAALLMTIVGCLVAELQSRRKPASATVGTSVLRMKVRGAPNRQLFGGAFVAWFAIVVLVVPMAADQYLQKSADAAAEGRLKDSIDDSRQALKLDPWSAAAHLQIGAIAQSLELYDRSIAEYSKAAELEPDNWQPPYLKASAELERGDVTAAGKDAAQAMVLNPRSPEVGSLIEDIDASTP